MYFNVLSICDIGVSLATYTVLLLEGNVCAWICVACEQAPGLEERSKFIGRRKAPATIQEWEACSQARICEFCLGRYLVNLNIG